MQIQISLIFINVLNFQHWTLLYVCKKMYVTCKRIKMKFKCNIFILGPPEKSVKTSLSRVSMVCPFATISKTNVCICPLHVLYYYISTYDVYLNYRFLPFKLCSASDSAAERLTTTAVNPHNLLWPVNVSLKRSRSRPHIWKR